MKVQFTDKLVRSLVSKLPSREQRQLQYREKQGQGRSGRTLVLTVGYGGGASWRIDHYKDGTRSRRLPDGSERIVPTRLSASAKLGSWPEMTLAEARHAARAFTSPVQGEASAKRDVSFATVAAKWLEERVVQRKLRTADQVRRHLTRYVLDDWGARPINEIDQDDVTALLERVTAEHGPAMADRLLTTVSSLMNWWKVKNKHYGKLPPAVLRGMRNGARSRKQVLDDRELRILWRLTGDGSVFSGLVRMLILSGQRLETVRGMRWSDIDSEGIWTVNVPDVDRMKGTIGRVKLPQLALDTLAALPRMVGSDTVFPGLTGALVDVSANKRRLCERMAKAMTAEHGAEMPEWRLHDLRRSFRTRLGEKCKVDPLTAELVIGHRIPGVAGIYDRGGYFEQKSEALDRFAAHLLSLVGANVAQFKPVAARASG